MRPSVVISGQWFWHSIARTILEENGELDEALINRRALLYVSLGVAGSSDSEDKDFTREGFPTPFGSEAGGPVA